MNGSIPRRLVLHGAILFLLGLLTGLVVQLLTNPRMGVSAHLEGVMNGTFLLALAAVWGHVRLAPRGATAAFWLLLYGTYGNWASVLFGAATGASRLAPISGAGHTGSPAAEAIMAIGLVSIAIAMIVALALVVRGVVRPQGGIP